MCTRLYPGLSREFAFSVGGETLPGIIARSHVETMAESLGMRPKFVLGLAEELADKMPVAVDGAIAEVTPALSHGGKDLAKRLRQLVLSTTRKVVDRLSR